MLTVGLIGKDGRTSAIAQALQRSDRVRSVVVLSEWKAKSPSDAIADAVEAARRARVDFVVVGPEAPLAAGVVDALSAEGIPGVGPTRALARLEASKSFTRTLLTKYRIAGNPKHQVFQRSTPDIRTWLQTLGEFVVKPDGLTGGKGVKVSGAHLHSIDEAVAYCDELFDRGEPAVVVEERLDGEEFSLQSFCDGRTLVHMPLVQDHKRAYEGDAGPNTGGMGSYSCADHKLPFVQPADLEQARNINAAVIEALYRETGERYRGILYGGFIVTADGVRLIEYNVRFGDPEALNVLAVLRTDLSQLFEAVVAGTLDALRVEFAPLSTVCKYIVPAGYPESITEPARVTLPNIAHESASYRIHLAAVDQRADGLYLTGSRAIAIVGIAQDTDAASRIADEVAEQVQGAVRFRRDIGTAALIDRRIEHVRSLRERISHASAS